LKEITRRNSIIIVFYYETAHLFYKGHCFKCGHLCARAVVTGNSVAVHTCLSAGLTD